MPTSPGMEMKVTPERDAPIIPNATRYHGDVRLPVKNVSLSALRPVKKLTAISKPKYARQTVKMNPVDIIFNKW